MEAFFNELRGEIVAAVREDAKKVLKEAGEERIYAAALVTDSDCITLFLAVNTYEKMREKDIKYLDILKNGLTEKNVEMVKSGERSITKWVPDEWAYSDGKGSKLNEVSRMLFAKDEENSAEYAKYKDLFFETVTEAWKTLIAEKVFGEQSEEITYFISVSDDGDKAEEIENYSASLLNSKDVYEKFLKRDDEMI